MFPQTPEEVEGPCYDGLGDGLGRSGNGSGNGLGHLVAEFECVGTEAVDLDFGSVFEQ